MLKTMVIAHGVDAARKKTNIATTMIMVCVVATTATIPPLMAMKMKTTMLHLSNES